MIESASSTSREAKRLETAHRIATCAQQLAGDRGLDGFTMEELAEAAGVSRRTLFNYYPGKIDACLGALPEVDADALTEFHQGGPSGDLVTDLGVLVRTILRQKKFTRDDARRGHALLRTNPQLMAAAHERFAAVTDRFVDEIHTREGKEFDEERARVAIRMLGTLFDLALERFLADKSNRQVADFYDDVLNTTRNLLT